MKTICLDPGHGMSNRKQGVYDPGTTHGVTEEATIVMKWVNCLRTLLMEKDMRVVRTRVDSKDPAPVGRRDDIARAYNCDLMISFHCNSGGGVGTETFYRGADDKAFAEKLNSAVVRGMLTTNRGAKTEKQSQHTSLAVMEFEKCWLIELGFLDHDGDRAKMLDDTVMLRTCKLLADVIQDY